ncbi:MAG: hypothetical protein ACTSWY_03970 [Promethearchaeota archaeon]
MSKDKFISILESSFEHGTPFIDYTSNYIYALIPDGNGKWNEVSYDIPGKELSERSITSTIAFRMIVEEIEKGLSMDLKDFRVNDFKNFRTDLEDNPDQEKVEAIIEEMTKNGKKYSENLPVIALKDKLDELKSKI